MRNVVENGLVKVEKISSVENRPANTMTKALHGTKFAYCKELVKVEHEE